MSRPTELVEQLDKLCRLALKRSGVNPTADKVKDCVQTLLRYIEDPSTKIPAEVEEELSKIGIKPDVAYIVRKKALEIARRYPPPKTE